MNTRLATALLTVSATAVAVLLASPASAFADCNDGDNDSGFIIDCNDTGSGSTPGSAGRPRYYAWEGTWIPLPGKLPTGEENGCWGARIVGGPFTTPPAGKSYTEAMAKFAENRNNGALWGECPSEEVFDLEGYIEAFWRGIARPPDPSPLRIAPGKMLVAFDAFLEIQGDPAPEWDLDNPIGADVVIEATPRYVIDWGDGGAPTKSTSRGGPFPDGDLTHAYANAGTYTVTVQAFWSGRWSAGDDGGALAELPVPTTSSITLPVEERQAVTD